ncbi:MAG: GntR family transcriptional regulator [Burkholderiales bacterium]|nr:GntR family transcriptional regulator [Betaproteobacteria bacterium]MBP8295283.1 GntR family transcriptional regulator [Burkholderiales bacterium]
MGVPDSAARKNRLGGLAGIEADVVSPLYHQIKENITRQIVSGRWLSGHELPSETDLCAHFGVSRGTLRRALDDLGNRGLIVRQQGRGTFVATPKFEGSVLGSYRNFRVGALPHDPVSRVLGIDRKRASSDLQRLLQLGRGDYVFAVRRVQFMEGVPITLSTSHIPAALTPGLDKLDIEHDLFYGLLEQRYGLVYLRAEEFLEPVIADDFVAQHLEVPEGSPVFLVERHSFLVGDKPGEFRQAYMRGDRYRYRIDLR